jgi:PAS domain S-box-containing protein
VEAVSTAGARYLLLLTDEAGALSLVEGSAGPVFGLGTKDLGRPLAGALESIPAAAEACAWALGGRPHDGALRVGGMRFDLRAHPLPNGGVFVLAVEHNGDLARSQAQLADAQRVAHVGSWEWEVAANVVSWSDELHRIYGLVPGQFEGTYEAFLARVHPDDKTVTQTVVLDAYRTVEPFIYDHRIVRPGGEVRMLHTRGDVVADEQGRPVRLVGSCWDITDRWSAEQGLARSVSLLRASLESTADGILVVDLQNKVAAFNQRLLDLWQISRAVVENTDFETLLGLVHEQLENGEACLKRVLELRNQPEAESFDSLRFHDGRFFERYSRPQRIGDQVVGRVWSYRDVTVREGLLRRAVFLADASRLLTSLDVEAGLEAVARLALPAMADSCAVDLFAESGGPRRLLSISFDPTRPMATELPRDVFTGQSQMRREGATSYIVVPVMARGEVLGALTFCVGGERHYGDADLALFQELAARAALAIESARQHRRAREALAARDEFLAIAAHEIRGPVTALHLAAQGLRPADTSPATRAKLLEIIEREDRRLSRFVDELLDVVQVRAGGLHFDLASVDLAEIVRKTVARLAPDITRSRSSLSVATTGAVSGIWDRERLEQVVTNLLTNAIKFGLGRPVEVTVGEAGGIARLTVRDHGLGITLERQQSIFEPFERAVSVRHYGGLGLGLYIVRRIVEGLHGTVTVQSTPDAGSTFVVELPQGRTP